MYFQLAETEHYQTVHGLHKALPVPMTNRANQADAFSILGSLTALNALEDYNPSMLFGEPTKRAR